MSRLFKGLKNGLEEALAHAEGKISLKSEVIEIQEHPVEYRDFIGQELQREVNTLGAKVQDKHVAYQVVMIKDLIEKIREQVQNVE